jgi:hypothetical protein
MAIYSMPGPVIAAGQSLSESVNCNGARLIRLAMPADWTPASLTFCLSEDGTAWFDLFNVQTATGKYQSWEAVINVAPGATYTLPTGTGGVISFLKLRSGTRQQPVKQTADRTFQLVLGPTA